MTRGWPLATRARDNAPVDVEAAIDELYGAPLDAFVAERKRLAAELRAAGDREGAARVAKLPKPILPAWALNRVAREAPDAVANWLDSAADLREATVRAREVGGDAIRAAGAAHRTAGNRLTTLVREHAQPGGRPLGEPVLDRVRAILQAAAGDPDQAARLRAGRLVDDKAPAPDIAALLTAAGAGPAPAPAADPAAAPPEAPDPEAEARRREAEARAARRLELERRLEEAIVEADRRRGEVARRAEAAAWADERLADARRALHRAESEAEAAHGAVADGERAAAEAATEVERVRRHLRDAG